MSAKTHFYIRTDRPRKDGSVPIILLFTISRNQRLKISTGKYASLRKEYSKLSPEQLKELILTKKEDLYYWDKIKERATKGCGNCERINHFLDSEKDRANKILAKYELMDKPITIGLFKNAYLRPNGTNTFYEYFKHELNKRRHLLSKGTFIGYMATVSKVNNFKPGLTLADIDYKFLTHFENHMLKPVSEAGLGNMATTIAKTMRTIRTLLCIAIKNR